MYGAISKCLWSGKAACAKVPAAQFPYLNGMSQQVIDGQHDGLHDFEFGLDLILQGLAALLAKTD